MFDIQANGTSANIHLDKDFYYEQSGKSPSDAVQNLIFFIENDLERLEMAESYLSQEGKEKLRLLKKFIRKPE